MASRPFSGGEGAGVEAGVEPSSDQRIGDLALRLGTTTQVARIQDRALAEMIEA